MRLAVRVTPRSGREAVEGWTTDPAGRPLLKVRVTAPDAEGQANAAVIALVAKAVGRPKSAVRLVRGETARIKQLEIDGVDAEALASAFGPPP